MASFSPNTKCFFLDSLPLELRLNVYEYLVLAAEPLRGRTAREKRTGLDLAILRTNRRIYEEAKAVFLRKNMFYITSTPNVKLANRKGEVDEAFDRFEPTFPSYDLCSLRHLTLDLVCRSAEVTGETGLVEAWQPADAGAAEYIKALIRLLQSTQLRTLHITAAPPSHFSAKHCLTAFFMADRDRSFAAALASLHTIKKISVRFEFPDCYYRTVVKPGAFVHRSILLLACQVMFCQSQTRIHQMMKDFEEGRVSDQDEEVEMMRERERVDLGPLVGAWPTKVPEPGEGYHAGSGRRPFNKLRLAGQLVKASR